MEPKEKEASRWCDRAHAGAVPLLRLSLWVSSLRLSREAPGGSFGIGHPLLSQSAVVGWGHIVPGVTCWVFGKGGFFKKGV